MIRSLLLALFLLHAQCYPSHASSEDSRMVPDYLVQILIRWIKKKIQTSDRHTFLLWISDKLLDWKMNHYNALVQRADNIQTDHIRQMH